MPGKSERAAEGQRESGENASAKQAEAEALAALTAYGEAMRAGDVAGQLAFFVDEWSS